MNQCTSAISKTTIKKSSTRSGGKKKSALSFVLHIPGYRQHIVWQSANGYIVELSRTTKGARCPLCSRVSKSLHGHYVRHLQALEIVGHSLTLLVKTRKFRCRNKDCLRKIFSEELNSVASFYSRNTLEVEERIREVSLKTTSRIASELLKEQKIYYSPSSCLRSTFKSFASKKRRSYPVAIGIDDFAQKKGHIYGSIIVDHITRRPIKILPEREGDELEEYLKENPQIQYITRDRGKCYVDAISRILPGATQICDRFHLIKNLIDALTEEISSLLRVGRDKKTYTFPQAEKCREKIMEALFSMGGAKERRKLHLFIKADSSLRKGMSIKEVATELQVHPQVIWRLVRGHTTKDYMSMEQKTILRYADELALEISHGCVDLKKLQQKMQSKMNSSQVARATIEIRKEIKQERGEIKKYNKSAAQNKKKKKASLMAIRHFVLSGDSGVECLNDLLKNPSTKNTITLALKFREMINGNPKQLSLDKWIQNAIRDHSKAIRTFALGIKADQQAVQNAMDIYLNNGILEGTVNKIKAIKRQMFNRASYKLLNIKLMAF